jgi:hypothetical protein
VLAVNQHSSGNRPLFNRDGLIAWTAEASGSRARYLALFNTRDVEATVSVDLATLGVRGRVRVRDLWARADEDETALRLERALPAHGAGFYRLG